MPFRTPIIMLGNQKSGTTAIASLLADYGNLTKTLDIPEMWKRERELHVGTLSLKSFILNYPHRFSTQVLKEPCLTYLYDECAAIFSSSPYVFIVRHPVDNIRSILNRLKIPGNQDYVDLNDYEMNNTWAYVMNGNLLNIDHDHYIARLALRWGVAAEIYLKNKEKMTLVRYEDFMENKYGTIERLAEGLGVPKEKNIASLLNFQYQPMGENRDTSVIDFFGEKNLSIIHDICINQMTCLDYAERYVSTNNT